MTHLSRTEFVDLIESSLPAERVRHLALLHFATCVSVRSEGLGLIGVTVAASGKSRRFCWTHFAARVSDAVRNEPAPIAPARWLRVPMVTWATAATVAALVIATTVWRTTLHAPSPMRPHSQQAAAPAIVPAASATATDGMIQDDADTDEAWAVVRTAAIDLNWDDVREAGSAPTGRRGKGCAGVERGRTGRACAAAGQRSEAERSIAAMIGTLLIVALSAGIGLSAPDGTVNQAEKAAPDSRPKRAAAAERAAGELSPGEVVGMFDAYALVQAQDAAAERLAIWHLCRASEEVAGNAAEESAGTKSDRPGASTPAGPQAATPVDEAGIRDQLKACTISTSVRPQTCAVRMIPG
jgi:hypothetical protein